MVVLAKPALERISLGNVHRPKGNASSIPVINLSDPEAKTRIIDACEELGFFKITNHGVPMEVIKRLEAQAFKFFSKTQLEKDKAGPANPFGYGSKRIGPNGDVGWVEYLLMQIGSNKPFSDTTLSFLRQPAADMFRSALNEYIAAVKKLSCEVLELMAEGLKIHPRDVFSKLVKDEESDLLFRLNHYPPCPQLHGLRCSLTGFGEHTDPQLISVLRSNKSTGLQISTRDGEWVSVPPDPSSFFINVGDILQVLTNGRFRSVRHRVLANGWKSRVSMIYFAGPPARERLAPLQLLMGEGEESRYREFTWAEYKSSAYKSRLADNRLGHFEK